MTDSFSHTWDSVRTGFSLTRTLVLQHPGPMGLDRLFFLMTVQMFHAFFWLGLLFHVGMTLCLDI